MIKIGNILIDPNDISSVHRDLNNTANQPNQRGVEKVQIIYKNGVVKNITSVELGMSYETFIDALIKQSQKAEDDKVFRMMAAIKSMNNE